MFAEKFPFFLALANVDRTGPYLSYSVKNTNLEVRVPLAVEQPWRVMSNGRRGLCLEELA